MWHPSAPKAVNISKDISMFFSLRSDVFSKHSFNFFEQCILQGNITLINATDDGSIVSALV